MPPGARRPAVTRSWSELTATHTFDGSSSVSFKIKELSEKKATRIRDRIKQLPEAAY